MTFLEAQQEFRIRYYLWATSEFEREVDGRLPDLKEFERGAVWEVLQFMQTLEKDGQMALASGLLKRFHPNAIKALGEGVLPEEDSIRRRFDRSRHEMGVAALACDEIKPKFISKSKLLKLMAGRFEDAFDGESVESQRVSAGDPYLQFQTRCDGGWIISTNFWFGRRASLIEYSHSISSENNFKHHGPQGQYMRSHVIASLISFSAWLGICSQTQWEHITSDEQASHACDVVIRFSKRFFEVAPKLLKQLEADKINPEVASI